MLVSNILETSGGTVVLANPDQPLAEMAQSLSEDPAGFAVICAEDGALVGVISERDIVRAVSLHGTNAYDMEVRRVMTRNVVTCKPDDAIAGVARLMTDRGIRHLPVVGEDGVAGVLTLSDLVRWRIT